MLRTGKQDVNLMDEERSPEREVSMHWQKLKIYGCQHA
jgi:hypothetical protein